MQSKNVLGPNSRPSACGRSVRSRGSAVLGDTTSGSCVAHRKLPQITAQPMPPAVPRASWASPLAIPIAGWPRHLFFGTFFFGPQGGGCLRPRAKTTISDAQGGTRGVWGLKGAVQGPQWTLLTAP